MKPVTKPAIAKQSDKMIPVPKRQPIMAPTIAPAAWPIGEMHPNIVIALLVSAFFSSSTSVSN